MNKSFASGFPLPKTMFVADARRGRDLSCQMFCFNSSRRSAFDCIGYR